MKRFKEVIKDIWRNYKIVIALSFAFQVLLFNYRDEIDLIWFTISYSIVAAPILAIFIYGIKEYFKK